LRRSSSVLRAVRCAMSCVPGLWRAVHGTAFALSHTDGSSRRGRSDVRSVRFETPPPTFSTHTPNFLSPFPTRRCSKFVSGFLISSLRQVSVRLPELPEPVFFFEPLSALGWGSGAGWLAGSLSRLSRLRRSLRAFRIPACSDDSGRGGARRGHVRPHARGLGQEVGF
jgi:hypothetical protein